jgi:hypothetical protein
MSHECQYVSIKADRGRRRRARYLQERAADLPSIAAGFCHQRPHQDADYREVGHQDR